MKNARFLSTFIVVAVCCQAVTAQSFTTDVFKTDGGKQVSITCIKHGSLMVAVDKQVIQIDPVGSYADYSLFPKATLVLITHEHGDHLDAKAITQVSTADTKVIANAASASKLENAVVMKNGEQLVLETNLTVKAVPAYNVNPERQRFHPQGNGNGYVLDIYGFRLYVAGDTEDIPELEQLKDIDVAFLPINQPYTMTVEQAIKAATIIKPKVLYPYHYGTTRLEPLVEALKGTAVEVRIRGME